MTTHDFFETLEIQFAQKKPFVVFKKSESTSIEALLLKSNDLFPVNYNEAGFIFAPFTSINNKSIWFPLSKATYIDTIFEKQLISEKNNFNHKNDSQKEFHINIVNKAIGVLKQGDLKKVVLSRKAEVKKQLSSPIKLFQKIIQKYPNAYTYCWHHPKIGLWMGATPETLIQLKGSNFKTMALAGTMLFKGNLNVKWGEKEIEEQNLVVKSILNELDPYTNHIQKGETKTVKAGSLLHLQTQIEGELKNSNCLQEVIQALHPTPAVCGLPKKKAKEFILKNENYDRGYYTGYLGVIAPKKETSLYVNLRCMELQNQKANLYVGGGITNQSNAEKEWIETVNKSQIMSQIL